MKTLRRRWPILLFVAWTAYVWVTRIELAWTASDESVASKLFSTLVASLLLIVAGAVAAALWRARARVFEPSEVRLVRGLAVFTAIVWAYRIPQILLDGGRDVPFKVVHLVLAAISLALAALSWRVVARDVAAARSNDTDPLVSPAANADR